MCKCGIVVRLLFLLYANLLILVTLCEGNHYPFIEERYKDYADGTIPQSYHSHIPHIGYEITPYKVLPNKQNRRTFANENKKYKR